MSGCRRIVPVAMHGASSRMASKGPPFHTAASAVTTSACKSEAREIFRQATQPRRRTVDRGHVRAGARELRGFSAGRSAQVSDGLSFDLAEKAHRQARGGVLHPPCAVVEAGQRGHRTMRDQSHGAIRQHAAAKLLRPVFRIAFHGEIERGLVDVRSRNRARGFFAVTVDPARQQPGRRVERDGVELRELRFSFARDPPQHGVHQARVARRMFLALHQTHGEIDGGVIGHIEKDDLSGA